MKEKIDLFAKGVFSYERPKLSVSVDSISIAVETGKSVSGFFSVSSSDGSKFKGIVFSSSNLLSIDNPTFFGELNTVYYKFDATYLERNDQLQDRNDLLKGRISVVTEYGEAFIPFKVVVRPRVCDTSIGPASDLFHYASLAQTDWVEAKNLFKSDDFRKTFSYSDPKFDTLVRALAGASNPSVALEEFLVSLHKKLPVNFSVEPEVISFDSLPAENVGFFTIKKDNWGYAQLTVESDGDFIEPVNKQIWVEEFVDNLFTVKFNILPEKLHAGDNLCNIIVKSLRKTVRIPVTVKQLPEDLRTILAHRRMRHFEHQLLSDFIDYRMGQLSAQRFSSEAERLLDTLKTFRTETLRERLMRIYILIQSGKLNKAILDLGVIEEDEDWKGKPSLYYALYVYLKTVLSNSNSAAAEAVSELRDLYERDGDIRIYLLCIELDNRNRISLGTRFDTMRRAFDHRPVHAPVLLEAAKIINEDPSVLKDFEGFDLQVISFAGRNNLINKQALLHVAYLATKCKSTSALALCTLKTIFSTFKINEVLEALCHHMIMGGVIGPEAYDIYNIAVIEQINVRGLYDNCLLSAGEGLDRPLAKPLISYFEGGNPVSESATTITALYANLLTFKSTGDDISPDRMRRIKRFAIDQLCRGNISRGLSVIYNNAIHIEDLSGDIKELLPCVCFKHLVEVDLDNATEVLVMHKELSKPTFYPVTDGRAFVDIYSDDPVILVVDEYGNRLDNIGIKITPMITNVDILTACCMDSTDERALIYSLEHARFKGSDEDTIRLTKQCAEIPNLDTQFRIRCICELIEYYYDVGEEELMEAYLVKIDLSTLERHIRSRMIDLMIHRDLYSLAMTNIELYGFAGVDVKRMTKLATKLIMIGSSQINSKIFLDMCICIFKKRKHTDEILVFLIRKYEADAESMHSVWLAAGERGIEASEIEERLLYTILFTENDMSFGQDVFKKYYGHSSPNRLIRAFLSYYAYGYMAYNRIPDTQMLELMRREANYEENDICTLAILKAYSSNESFTEPDRIFIERALVHFENKGILFPFFKNFGKEIRVPGSMSDKCYVEYHTDPRKRVKIHYIMVDSTNDNYTVEDMKDIGYGIFVKEFVLFCGEAVQYYISEEYEGQRAITEASEVGIQMESVNEGEGRYHQLNFIITAQELNDGKTMQKLLEHYVRAQYLTKKLFKPLF